MQTTYTVVRCAQVLESTKPGKFEMVADSVSLRPARLLPSLSLHAGAPVGAAIGMVVVLLLLLVGNVVPTCMPWHLCSGRMPSWR